jgi:type IV pilus assembly protein PilY1
MSTQNIISYFVGFGSVGSDPAAVDLLDRASNDTHGKGHYYLAENQAALSNTLSTIMSQINSVNSSYVAPVVPVSPQNRTYGSSRVFMGFFRPNGKSYWSGNLKKYALDASNFITDENGNNATWRYRP